MAQSFSLEGEEELTLGNNISFTVSDSNTEVELNSNPAIDISAYRTQIAQDVIDAAQDSNIASKSDLGHTHASDASKLDIAAFDTDRLAQESRLDTLEAVDHTPQDLTPYRISADQDLIDAAQNLAISGKADNHTHPYASDTHNHDLDYSDINHSHTADSNKLDVSVYDTDVIAQDLVIATKANISDTDTSAEVNSKISTAIEAIPATDLTPYRTSLNQDIIDNAQDLAISGKADNHTHPYASDTHNHGLEYSDINHSHTADSNKLDVSVFTADQTSVDNRLDTLEAIDHTPQDLSSYETIVNNDVKLLDKANLSDTNYALSNPYLNPNPFFDNGIDGYIGLQSSDIVTDVVNSQTASLKIVGHRPIHTLRETNEISVKQSFEYRAVFTAKCTYDGGVDLNKSIRFYVGVEPYDSEGLAITSYHNNKEANTTTTLTSDLNDGDTVINVADTSNWNPVTAPSHHRFVSAHPLRPDGTYGYIGTSGRYYDELKYTRYISTASYTNITPTSVTLGGTWQGGFMPAGSKISNARGGSSYSYWITDYRQPCDGNWITLIGEWMNPSVGSNLFNGAASAIPIALLNHQVIDNNVFVSDPVERAKYMSYISTIGFEGRSKEAGLEIDGKLDSSVFTADQTSVDSRLDILEAVDHTPQDLSAYETIANNEAKLSNKANISDTDSSAEVDAKIAAIPPVDLSPYRFSVDQDVIDTAQGAVIATKANISDTDTTAEIDAKLSTKSDNHSHPYSLDTHTHNPENTFNVNGSSQSSQQDGLYVADLGVSMGTTNNPLYTVSICGQINDTRSIALSVDSQGYLYGWRGHSSVGTYTFESKVKLADLANNATSSDNSLDSDKLGGIFPYQFLRSDEDDSITGNLNSSGHFSTSSFVEAGYNSGSVALTTNDGYGNANIAFNHRAGFPDSSGSSSRIVSSVDSTTGSMNFFVADNTTSGVLAPLGAAQTQVLSNKVRINVDAEISGDITVTGNVDGRDVAADGAILDGLVPNYITKTASFTQTATEASTNSVYLIDTTAGQVNANTVTNPVDGDHIRIVRLGGDWTADSVVVTRGTKTIMGLSQNLTINEDIISITLMYIAANTDWIIINKT